MVHVLWLEDGWLSGCVHLSLNIACTIAVYIYINQCIYTWNPNDPSFEWSFGLLLEGSNPKIEDKQVPSTQHKYSKSNQEQWHNIEKIRLYRQYPFFLNVGSLTSIIHKLGHPEAPRLGQAFSATWRCNFPGSSRGILSIHTHLLKTKHSNYTPQNERMSPKKGPVRRKRLVFQPL